MRHLSWIKPQNRALPKPYARPIALLDSFVVVTVRRGLDIAVPHRCGLCVVSVDGSGRYDPLTRLSGHRSDEVEVAVVVKHRVSSLFGGSSDQQIGDLTTPPAVGGEKALDLSRSLHMSGGGLNQLEDVESPHELLPFCCGARRVAHLEVADPGSRSPA
jgi:hypothetical protein